MIWPTILALTTISGGPCPPVAQVRAPTAGESAIRIAFLPEGFTEGEFPRYRCAVRTVTERLLAEPPFSVWAPWIGVERMEFVSGDGRVETAPCSQTCTEYCTGTGPCVYGDEYWGAECSGNGLSDPAPVGGLPYPTLDFDVKVCGGGAGTRCEWLGVGDFGEITDLSTCFTAPTIMVVLAKRFGVGGGVGKEQVPPLAVVTVEGIQTEAAARRLAHEIGHALGLQDEYGSADPQDVFDVTIEPPCGRNVVVTGTCCGWGIPWSDGCVVRTGFDNGCPDAMDGCASGDWPLKKCEIVRHVVSCGTAAPCTSYYVPPDATTLAVVEQAFYRDCDAFRPASVCRMRHHMDGFCPVCESWLHESFESMADGTQILVLNLRRIDTRRRVRPPGPDPTGPDWEFSGLPAPLAGAPPSWARLAGARIVEIDEVVERPGFRALVPLRSLDVEFQGPDGTRSRVTLNAAPFERRRMVDVEGTPPAPRRDERGERWLFTPRRVAAVAGRGATSQEPNAFRVRYIPAK